MKLFLTLLLALTLTPRALAALPANTVYELNNRMGPIAFKYQLGTLLNNNQSVDNSASLANGKVWVGDSGGLAQEVTPSGDVTWSNAGVTAIGAGKVTEAMLLPMAGSTSSLSVHRTAHLIWDPTTTAAHRTGTAVAFGAGFGASIPANSLIVRVYYYTKTAVVSTGNNGTIAFNCLNAGDLQAAVDPDSTWGLANGMGSGTITGIQVAGVSLIGLVVAAGCSPTFTVATNNFTGGRVHIYIDYVTFD